MQELRPSVRNQIQVAQDSGKSLGEIAKLYNIPKSTVKNALKLAPRRISHMSRPRPGRTPKLPERQKRHIKIAYERNPKQTYAELISLCCPGVSHDTVYRLTKTLDIYKKDLPS
jgi:transposase